MLGARGRPQRASRTRRARPARRPRRPRAGARSSRRARAGGAAARPPGPSRGASCSPPRCASSCRASRGSAASARARPPRRSRCVIAPPSPRQGRFLEGKKLNVAASPSAPAFAPPRDAPAAWAASSSTGSPELAQLGHGRHVAEQVHRHDRLRPVAQVGRDGLGGDAAGVRVHVAEDRPRAGVHDRLGGRVEGERGADHLVAGRHAQRAQRDRQRVGAVAHADRVAHAEIGGELALERLELRPEDVAAGGGDLGQALDDPLPVGLERGCEQGYLHGPEP